MAYCRECGNRVESNASFCRSCGSRIAAPTLVEDAEVLPPTRMPVPVRPDVALAHAMANRGHMPPRFAQPAPQYLHHSPSTVSVVVNTTHQYSYHGIALVCWILLALCCGGALIPGLGFAVWIIAFPVLLVTFVLGCVAIARGGTLQGVLILLASLIGAPVFIAIAPIVTTALVIAGSTSQ